MNNNCGKQKCRRADKSNNDDLYVRGMNGSNRAVHSDSPSSAEYLLAIAPVNASQE
jgi:hypothetical protein